MKKITPWIFSILFIFVVGLSIYTPYWLISSPYLIRIWSFPVFFAKYSLIVLPLLVVWLGLLLSKGKWREVKNYTRMLIVFVSIFVVASFCILKWTNTVNNYGIYGHYIKNAESTEEMFRGYIIDKNSTSFEKETIYREMMGSVYDIEFKKMWTFSTFVFLSAFLLLNVIPKKKE